MKLEIDFFIETENQKVLQLSPDKKLYISYSPTIFKLRRCESIMLILQLKIKLADETKGVVVLLPSLILQKLIIENFKHLTRETQNEVIKLDLLNKRFNDSVKVKKNQEIAGLILLHKDNR